MNLLLETCFPVLKNLLVFLFIKVDMHFFICMIFKVLLVHELDKSNKLYTKDSSYPPAPTSQNEKGSFQALLFYTTIPSKLFSRFFSKQDPWLPRASI